MEDAQLNDPHEADRPYSQKELWFIAKSLQLHIEQLEERLQNLVVVDGDLKSEDEAADLVNDTHLLKMVRETTLEKYHRFV